ncbi:hypothetical protein [Streptomyces purpureus]|uniref:Uncharacterized protein n=1 Tax=Streptomyces purpureus TaxID=1951 RepID=A0A918LN50_9ACTN|nr:hypothetical protein [Streptomyces purpureus]GGT26324.1 hypothetical protein GCM10014713_19290 [Streptomyces purpureus]
MIELGILAGVAIGIAGDFLAGVAQNMAASAVTDLVRQRLQSTEEGVTALARLEEAPQDPGRRMAAAGEIAAAAQSDRSYAQALNDAVGLYHKAANQGTATSGSPHHQVNINGGGVSGKGAQVAGGNIDSSKRSNRFGIGGSTWLLLLLGGVVAGGVIYVTSGEDSDSLLPGLGSPGATQGVASVGAAPGEDGVRETWTAYAKAISGRDATTACTLHTPDARTKLEQKMGECDEYFKEAFNSADSGSLQVLGNGTVQLSKVVVKSGIAELTLREPGDTPEDLDYIYMERFGDRWRISGEFLYRHFHDCPSDPRELASIYTSGGDRNCLVGAD